MGSVIERKPWTILAAWIIVVMLLAPLAANINDVVKTSEKEFLPSTVESVKASKELSKLAGDGGGMAAPPFMLVVHGVPVGKDSYLALRDWYHSLKADYNGRGLVLFTWIDIVDQAYSSAREGLEAGVNGSLQAVEGLVRVAEAYNRSLESIQGLSMLVQAADQAYTGYWQAGLGLQQALPAAEGAYQALNLSCNVFLPTIATTYYNIVRTQALLINATTAYETGLTPEDVEAVVEASNVSGIGPVDPALVYAVYNYTVAIGGPGAWSNERASALAAELAWTTLASMGFNETLKPFYDAVAGVWAQVVAGDVDHVEYLLSQGIVEGQYALASRIDDLAAQAIDTVIDVVGDAYKSLVPAEAQPIVDAVVNAYKPLGCGIPMHAVLQTAFTGVLTTQGMPADAARVIARDVVQGNFTREEAARLAVATVVSQAPTAPPGIEEPLVTVLLAHDPDASGALTGPKAYGVAGILFLGLAGVEADNATVTQLLAAGTPEEAALVATRVLVAETAGEQGVMMLGLLQQKGLLGKPAGLVLQAAPDLLAPVVAEQAGIDPEQAKAVVQAAVRVYLGEATPEEAVDELAAGVLDEIINGVAGELRGVMIEEDGNGFIVGVNYDENMTLEEAVAVARSLRDEFRRGLEEKGYAGGEVVLGGDNYSAYVMREAARSDIEKSDRLSMVFVMVILAIVLESIVAVFLPFIGIGMGLVASLAAAYVLAKAGLVDVTTHSRTIMFTTGLGLGIDYAAYVSKRFREAAARGLDSRKAAAEAFHKSARPVMAGAVTAMIGFGSMVLAWDFPFVASVGTNVPLTIAAVMVASLTFIPALLAYVGEKRWFWWPRHPVEHNTGKHRLAGLGRAIAGKPLAPLALVLLMALFAGYVMAGFQGSYDFALNLPPGSEPRKAIEMVNTYYDPGVLYPVLIVASSQDKAQEVADAVAALDCVAKTRILEEYQGRVVEVVMSVYPLSKEGVDCVAEIREAAHRVDEGSLVGGASAVNLDLRDMINDRFYHRVYPAALVLMILTFLVAYGGLATALAAVFSVALAAYAGSALTIVYYEHIVGSDVIWYLPVIVFTAILGVGMDYNSFYIARAREECEVKCSREAIADSIAKGSAIVVGLAVIMAGAYLGLAMASSPGLSMMGTALVLGVLLAGINASLILTPPLIALLGKKAWWPKPPREAR